MEPRFYPIQCQSGRTFSPLPARHVDTGMGFERVTALFKALRASPTSAASSPITKLTSFRPIFDRIEKLSGKKYRSTLPASASQSASEQEKMDVAFRVIADHIRTLSFAIADGIQPGNTDRNYVLRRILRRAVRYGRSLGFHGPFFYKLAGVLLIQWGSFSRSPRQTRAHRRGYSARRGGIQQNPRSRHRAVPRRD